MRTLRAARWRLLLGRPRRHGHTTDCIVMHAAERPQFGRSGGHTILRCGPHTPATFAAE